MRGTHMTRFGLTSASALSSTRGEGVLHRRVMWGACGERGQHVEGAPVGVGQRKESQGSRVAEMKLGVYAEADIP